MGAVRRKGWEWQVVAWLARHPGLLLGPGVVGAGAWWVGVRAVGLVCGGLLLGLLGWYRGHPASFDRWASPRLRAWRRRWFSLYTGPRWRNTLAACDLAVEQRGTDELAYPRLLRVSSPSPSVDVLRVRLQPGQALRTWEQKLPELTETLRAERVALERVKPGVLGLIVQRSEPFTESIEPPPMPWEVGAVNPRRVWCGVDEYGNDWYEPIPGNNILVAGATGTGKATMMHGPVYQLAPLVKAGLVRLWDIDPKRLELSTTQAISYRYACEPTGMEEVLAEYLDNLEKSQRKLSAFGWRKAPVSPDFPLDILRVDELAAVLGYGENLKTWKRSLGIITTQGRTTNQVVWAAVQEPTKEIVPVRECFPRRLCLRTTSASHVDMMLGEDARLQGALADEIPDVPESAGIGYIVQRWPRRVVRVRTGHYTDTHLRQLVAFITDTHPGAVQLGTTDPLPIITP